MTEQEARKEFSHLVSLYRVFGGDLRKMCAERGVPDALIEMFIAEKEMWDLGLAKFDWDGSARKNEG